MAMVCPECDNPIDISDEVDEGETVQCDEPVIRLNVVGEQLLSRLTAPCCLLNATGIVTGVPPDRGVSVIRPKYWPSARFGAEMTTRARAEPPRRMCRSRFELNEIDAPAGAATETSRSTSRLVTFVSRRLVNTVPGIVGASMLGRLRLIRPSGSAADAT